MTMRLPAHSDTPDGAPQIHHLAARPGALTGGFLGALRAGRGLQPREFNPGAARKRAARVDPAVRAAEQAADSQRRGAARADPAVRAREAAQLAARRNAVAAAGGAGDGAGGSGGGGAGVSNGQAAAAASASRRRAAPTVNLTASLHSLLKLEYLGPNGRVPELPPFLMELPEGRVQDLPDGQLLPERQVPYTVHLEYAARMAAELKASMPSRVCAVCSGRCSAAESSASDWDLPGIELTRADIMRTGAVARPAHTLAWRRVPCTPQGGAPPPPDPALPHRYRLSKQERERLGHGGGAGGGGGEGGGGRGGGAGAAMMDDEVEGGAGEDEEGDAGSGGEDGLHAEPPPPPPELQPKPPRVLPRPCSDAPGFVEVPYCLRLEREGPSRTVEAGADGKERFYVCHDCSGPLASK